MALQRFRPRKLTPRGGGNKRGPGAGPRKGWVSLPMMRDRPNRILPSRSTSPDGRWAGREPESESETTMRAHNSIFSWRSSRSHLGPKLGSMLVAALIVAPLNVCAESVRQELDHLTRRGSVERVHSTESGRPAAAGERSAMLRVAPR